MIKLIFINKIINVLFIIIIYINNMYIIQYNFYNERYKKMIISTFHANIR